MILYQLSHQGSLDKLTVLLNSMGVTIFTHTGTKALEHLLCDRFSARFSQVLFNITITATPLLLFQYCYTDEETKSQKLNNLFPSHQSTVVVEVRFESQVYPGTWTSKVMPCCCFIRIMFWCKGKDSSSRNEKQAFHSELYLRGKSPHLVLYMKTLTYLE